MTDYVNPSTRVGGVKRIVVADRRAAVQVLDAPFDDEQYVRVNGEWVPVDTPEIVPDTLAPKPPTALGSSGVITNGGAAVNYTLTWTAPTQNTDNTPLTDLAYYVVRWRYEGTGPWASFVSDETSAMLHGLPLGKDIDWEVLARDISGNDSSWVTANITGLIDITGPERPSAPIVTSRLGTITASWNGLDHVGNPPPADFDHLDFYMATVSGGPWTLVGRASGVGSVFVTNVPIGQTRYFSTVAVDSSGNTSPRSVEVSILVVGVTGPDLEANSVTANAIAVGAVAASKISTGALAADVEIIAGNPVANHAKMTDLGFKVMIEDPVDLVPNEVVRMGSDTGDLFAITDAFGMVKASISETGQGAFTGLSVDATELDAVTGDPTAGLTVYGKEFLEYFKERPRGLVAYAVTSGVTWNISDVETPLFEFAFDGDPTREFWFHIDPMVFDVSGSADARVALLTRTTIGGTTQPTVASSLMRQSIGSIITGLPVSLPMDVTGQFSYYTRVLVSAVIYSGATAGTVVGNNGIIRAAVYDMGPKQETSENTFVNRYAGASPPSTKTYTSTWHATNSMGYTGSNVADNDPDLKQGYSSYDGDSHGVIIFGGNAASGETTKTIASALSGATIKKVEVYLYFNHWYYNSGGTALIRAYNSTSLSSSTPSGTIKSSSSWPKPGGRWVDITSIATTAIRGVTVGKAGSTNLIYYGRVNGHTMSNKPQMRITYVR